MKWKAIVALTVVVTVNGCGQGLESRDETVETIENRAQALASGEVFKIGVLLDDASPAKANYAAAANLAESQLNQGLASAGSANRYDVIVVNYAGGQVQDAAIDLINNQGVFGLVTDTSDTTAQVNSLNYEFVPRINRKVPVTCSQCSSPLFHSFDGGLGYMDFDFWLFRTFFNERFELPLQVRFVLRRPRQGDFNRDGHLKIVVYADSGHYIQSLEMASILDRLHSGSHSVEVVLKSTPFGQPPAPSQLDEVFDDQIPPPGTPDRFPDAVFLNLSAENTVVVLQAIRDYPLASKPPISVNEAFRRDHLLTSSPALWEGLEGSSPLRVASGDSGAMFRSAFVAATGVQPESTASFLYDAVVIQAGAIGWAFHFGSTDPEVIKGNVPNVNDPSGRVIRPRPADFKLAAQRIDQEQPINYEGASSSVDVTFGQDNEPDLVRWKVQNGQFVEQEIYTCNAANPDCRRR